MSKHRCNIPTTVRQWNTAAFRLSVEWWRTSFSLIIGEKAEAALTLVVRYNFPSVIANSIERYLALCVGWITLQADRIVALIKSISDCSFRNSTHAGTSVEWKKNQIYRKRNNKMGTEEKKGKTNKHNMDRSSSLVVIREQFIQYISKNFPVALGVYFSIG